MENGQESSFKKAPFVQKLARNYIRYPVAAALYFSGFFVLYYVTGRQKMSSFREICNRDIQDYERQREHRATRGDYEHK